MADVERVTPEGSEDFVAPVTGEESGAESRVENPLVARIVAEREDRYRDVRSDLEAAKQFRRLAESIQLLQNNLSLLQKPMNFPLM